MQCLDCAMTMTRETPACATCHTCGAGVCVDHVVEGYAQQEVHSLGQPSIVRLPGRRVYCRTCAPAYLEPAAPGTRLAADG